MFIAIIISLTAQTIDQYRLVKLINLLIPVPKCSSPMNKWSTGSFDHTKRSVSSWRILDLSD